MKIDGIGEKTAKKIMDILAESIDFEEEMEEEGEEESAEGRQEEAGDAEAAGAADETDAEK